MNNKILFISYYFPPSSNSGSHRVLRLINELKNHKWDSIVITVKDGMWGKYNRTDNNLSPTLSNSIYRTRMLYPFKKSTSLIAKIIRRIWSEITFPDDKVFWAITAYFKARQIIKNQKIDAVFITASPYSSLTIGLLLKQTLSVPVIVDYRDPWTGDSYYIKRKWKHRLSKLLEKKIQKKVDRVYSVTPMMTDYLMNNTQLPKSAYNKFKTLTYSFSKKDYYNIQPLISKTLSSNFILNFSGNSFGVGDPMPLLKAIKLIKREKPDIFDKLLVLIIGNLLENYEQKIEEMELKDKILIMPFMTYNETLSYMKTSHILTLPYKLHNHMKICLPVKIFDYLALEKPILYYGSEGQIINVIRETCSGYFRQPDDIVGISNDICDIFRKYNNNNFNLNLNKKAVSKYYTENVVGSFVSDLNQLLK